MNDGRRIQSARPAKKDRSLQHADIRFGVEAVATFGALRSDEAERFPGTPSGGRDAEALRDFYCEALGYEPKGGGAQYRACVPGGGGTGPKLAAEFASGIKRVSALAFSPDGSVLAVGDDAEGVVQLWALK